MKAPVDKSNAEVNTMSKPSHKKAESPREFVGKRDKGEMRTGGGRKGSEKGRNLCTCVRMTLGALIDRGRVHSYNAGRSQVFPSDKSRCPPPRVSISQGFLTSLLSLSFSLSFESLPSLPPSL